MADDLGSVYVFNVYSETLTLSTNGATVAAGAIPGWFTNATPKYRPNAIAVPRTLNASDGPGRFFNGKNALTISWADGLFAAQVPIDGKSYPIIQDLLLFIDKNSWSLVNQYGIEVENGPVLGVADFDILAPIFAKA
ncbi:MULTISPECIES: hypothetical protein [Rhodopseudomonas]|uniref:Uncharacterized protein n=1 Tax=Rhodopseudomonas palustris TaxID=1076 RepID=A0A0D7F2H2_RHOPL|nr:MULTISPECIES: hypothetical protein [Rhodopseudomonas]KIZ47288.1 hypothetical protein OO17_05155 [Rhodopseudomonas palustris]MDF3811581.1 hypothetical protein [Rhodopseudomonas sp. BAL398]WOK19904.1 hypothetical protein RBJ75_10455 [Rhodopseudomonas sp. BAL398]